MTETSGVQSIMDGLPGATPVPLTLEQAKSLASQRSGDTVWKNKLFSRDPATVAEMSRIQEGLRRVDLNIVGGSAASALDGVHQQIAEREVTEGAREASNFAARYDFSPEHAQELVERKPISQELSDLAWRNYEAWKDNPAFNTPGAPNWSRFGAAMALRTFPVER